MRKKQARFSYIKAADNVIQEGKPLFGGLKGKWCSLHFKNDQPITLELACGRGEYTIALARIFPERNFVGLDIKGDRLWMGSKIAHQEGLTNVAFLRALVHDLDVHFASDEVSEIWLTFPDPRPKDRDERRRLTFKRFIALYKQILKPGGYFKLKTDNTGLFEYTLEELDKRPDVINLEFTYDLAGSELLKDHYGIITRYEEMFTGQGETIKYLKFKFKNE
jgi:tRNA (guanine-N7-)-methyltransferase